MNLQWAGVELGNRDTRVNNSKWAPESHETYVKKKTKSQKDKGPEHDEGQREGQYDQSLFNSHFKQLVWLQHECVKFHQVIFPLFFWGSWTAMGKVRSGEDHKNSKKCNTDMILCCK